MQGIHRLAARRAGGGVTVPVLVTPDGVSRSRGRSSTGSIGDRRRSCGCSGRAGRGGERERMCRRFDDERDRAAGGSCTSTCSAQPALMLRFNNAGVPRWEIAQCARLAACRALRPAPAGHPIRCRAGRRGGRLARVRLRRRAARGRPPVPVRRPLRRGRPDLRGAVGRGRRPRTYGVACRSPTSCRRTPPRSSRAREHRLGASRRPFRRAIALRLAAAHPCRPGSTTTPEALGGAQRQPLGREVEGFLLPGDLTFTSVGPP